MIGLLVLIVVWAIGMAAGALLFKSARDLPGGDDTGSSHTEVAIIIPARNEETSLAVLLQSVASGTVHPDQLLVVDDESTDQTAAVAQAFGADVIQSTSKPDDWLGKPWACWQGAQQSTTKTLLFVDADTWFEPSGLHRILNLYRATSPVAPLSVLPFHVVRKPYEQLSLFFNVLLAAGAGGFSGFDRPSLFGQSLLIDRDLYFETGGHQSVRTHVLENLHLAAIIHATGRRTQTALGRGALSMRMFPEGFGQLCASWRKGFASGARATPPVTMALSILWLSALMSMPWFFVASPRIGSIFYIASALHVWWTAKRVGTFHWMAALLFPIPLLFYIALFASTLVPGLASRQVVWKGRRV